MTKKFYNQLEPEIRPATADVYLRVVRLMLGWRLTHAQVCICVAATQPLLGSVHIIVPFDQDVDPSTWVSRSKGRRACPL